MDFQEKLQLCIDFAKKSHFGQKRKNLIDDFVVHPIGVMKILLVKFENDLRILAAALFHDILEDTLTNKEDIKNFLITIMEESDVNFTLQLIIDLTDVFTFKDYPELNRRQRKEKERQRLSKIHPFAQTIKYCDIINNCKDLDLLSKEFNLMYLEESELTLDNLNDGDIYFKEMSLNSINEGFKKLL